MVYNEQNLKKRILRILSHTVEGSWDGGARGMGTASEKIVRLIKRRDARIQNNKRV